MFHPYPALKVEHLSTIVRIIRERSFEQETPLLAKCAYTLVGAGLKMMVGEPEGVPLSADLAEALPVDDLVAAQSALRGLVEDGLPRASHSESAESLGPTSLLIELALKAIAQIIERRKNQD